MDLSDVLALALYGFPALLDLTLLCSLRRMRAAGNTLSRALARCLFWTLLWLCAECGIALDMGGAVPLALYSARVLLLPLLAGEALTFLWYYIVRRKESVRHLRAVIAAACLVNAAVLGANVPTGLYFTAAGGTLRPGLLYPLFPALAVVPLPFAAVLLWRARKRLAPRELRALVLIPLPLFAAAAAQLILIGDRPVVVAPMPVLCLTMLILFLQYQRTVTDYLTGLYNRYFIEDTLRKRIRRGSEPFTAVLMDLDHFKQINDTYGHREGDLVLRTFSNILRANLRRVDAAGRYGGDEFLILVNTADRQVLRSILARLQENLDRVNRYLDGKYRIEWSCGWAVYDAQLDLSADALIREADRHLYADKFRKKQLEKEG